MSNPSSVFIMYAREDADMKNELKAHFRPAIVSGLLRLHHDAEIPAGEHWEKSIQVQITNADIILFLCSSSFLDSDFIRDIELPLALKRHEEGKFVIPVILRPCDWELELGHLMALPKGASPVSTWPNMDEAYNDIVEGVKALHMEILDQKASVYFQEQSQEEIIENGDPTLSAINHWSGIFKWLDKGEAEAQFPEKRAEIAVAREKFRNALGEHNSINQFESKIKSIKLDIEHGKWVNAIQDTQAFDHRDTDCLTYYPKGKIDLAELKSICDRKKSEYLAAFHPYHDKAIELYNNEQWGQARLAFLEILQLPVRILNDSERKWINEELKEKFNTFINNCLAKMNEPAQVEPKPTPVVVIAPPSVPIEINKDTLKKRFLESLVFSTIIALLLVFPKIRLEAWARNILRPEPPPKERNIEALLLEVKAGMVEIEHGTFIMGDVLNEGNMDERPQHAVKIKDFSLSKHEVSQELWKVVMKSLPPDQPIDDLSAPVVNVSWNMVQQFIQTLNQLPYSPGGYRLPSEAEWEYAAREGGRSIRFGNGKDTATIEDMNFDCRTECKKPYSIANDNISQKIHLRKGKENALGLCNMAGNVNEWCQDSHESYSRTPCDGTACNESSSPGGFKVYRGGSWWLDAFHSRACKRNKGDANTPYKDVGFRLAQN